MPSRRHADTSRTEARRRSRMIARGEEVEEGAADATEVSQAGSASARPAGGFLGSLFPAAPPLPGLGDPQAGFSYHGPRLFHGAALTAWLLGRRPYAWLGMGALWLAARLLTWADQLVQRLANHGGAGTVGIVASFVSFGALIVAGWLGWRRPWLYGLAASLVGVLGYALTVTLLVVQNGGGGPLSGEVLVAALAQEGFQIFFGILGGWYGGYFRRRTASQRASTQGRRRR